ncbi:MAG: hypothetical protein ABL957_11320 [Parvularculaceae bacterium]
MFKAFLLGFVAALTLQSAYGQPVTANARPSSPAPGPTAAPPAGLGAPQAVEQTQLAEDAFATGTLARGQGALEPTLWKRADPARVGFLLDAAPARPSGPSLGEALRRTLLTPGESPQGAPVSLGGKKLLVLARAGFIEEARTIASLSNAARNDPFVGQALAVADLLDGSANEACKRNASLTSGRDAPFWVKLRVLCFSMTGAKDAADLSLTLLREQGFLNDADSAILAAVVAGAQGIAPAAPQNALHLASLRFLQAPIVAGMLSEADAGVLKAIANDGAVAQGARVEAAVKAAAMGVVSHGELQALFDSFEVEVGDVGRASDLARARSGDPLADVILYKSVRAMSAPEFLRDKAARLAEALALADTFPRAYAASVLYAEDIAELEGALVSPAEAGRFAVARMALGDGDGAARWLFSMIGAGVSSLSAADSASLGDLVNLLAILDPISAKAVAEAANIGIETRAVRPQGAVGAPLADSDAAARIIESAFDAAIDDSPGQAALAALASSTLIWANDPTGRVIISQSLRAAGFNELRRRMDFEAVWRGRFALEAAPAPVTRPAPAPVSASPAGAAPALSTGGAAVEPKPRVKPKRDQG